jgi:hypothetical protein
MADDLFSKVYGTSGAQVGALLARNKKVSFKDLRPALLLGVINEASANKNKDVDDSIEELKAQMGLRSEKVISQYNNERNTLNRKEYYQYKNPINRDNFLNEKIKTRYESSSLKESLGGLSYDELLKSKDPNIRNAFAGFKKEEQKMLVDYYDALEKDPYVSMPIQDIQQLQLDHAVALANQIKDDPTKTSLFYSAIDKIFPGLNANNKTKLKLAVEETQSKLNEINTARDTVQKELTAMYSTKPIATKDTEGNLIYRPFAVDQEVFNDANNIRKDIIKNFESFANDEFNIRVLDPQNNELTKQITTPFKNFKNAEVEVYNPETKTYEVNKNLSVQAEVSSAIANIVAMEKQVDKIAGIVPPRQDNELYNDAIQTLVNNGNIVIKGSGYLDGAKRTVFQKPNDLMEIYSTTNEIPPVMQNYINALHTDMNVAENQKDEKAPKVEVDAFVTNLTTKRIDEITNDLENEQDPERIEDLNNERDRLTDTLKGTNQKLVDQTRLRFLIAPPKEDIGKVVYVQGQKFKLGEMPKENQIAAVNAFTALYGESDVLNTLISMEDEEDTKTITPITASKEVLDKFTPNQLQQYNSKNEELKQIEIDLQDTRNLSKQDIVLLNVKKDRIENSIRKLIEGPLISFAGLTPEEKERKALEQDLRVVNNQLQDSDRFSPNELEDLKERQKELETILNIN